MRLNKDEHLAAQLIADALERLELVDMSAPITDAQAQATAAVASALLALTAVVEDGLAELARRVQ